MIDKNTCVLVVDDNEDFAKACTDNIERKCRVKAAYATTAEGAKEIVKNYPIKVVILDQVMPTKGTVLFGELKKIDSRIKTILITSEEQDPEIMNALNMNFDNGLMKIESDKKLASMILALLLKYDTELCAISEPPFHTEKKGGLLKKFNVSYSIVSYEIINKKHYFDDEWISHNFIEKGGEVELSEEVNFETDFNFSKSVHIDNNVQMQNSIGMSPAPGLTMEFNNEFLSHIEELFDYKYTENIKKVFKKKWSLSIPSDSEKVVSRVYEYTKVYWQVKLYIKQTCSCCCNDNLFIKNIYVPIPTVKYRIKEYLDSEVNNCRIIDSGEYVSEYHPQILKYWTR